MTRWAFDPRVDYARIAGVTSNAPLEQLHSTSPASRDGMPPDIRPGSSEAIIARSASLDNQRVQTTT